MKSLLPVFMIIVFIAAIVSGCASTTGNAGLKIGLCGEHEEKYTTGEKGCENMDKCKCIHENFFGSCDNCECTRTVSDC